MPCNSPFHYLNAPWLIFPITGSDQVDNEDPSTAFRVHERFKPQDGTRTFSKPISIPVETTSVLAAPQKPSPEQYSLQYLPRP